MVMMRLRREMMMKRMTMRMKRIYQSNNDRNVIRYLAASNGDSSGDTSFRLSGRSSSSSSSDRSASGKQHHPLHRNVLACTFLDGFFAE